MQTLHIEKQHQHSLSITGVSQQFEQELRCSHAGETGAVWIYRGILAARYFRRPDREVLEFAREHLSTEQRHLQFFDELRNCYRTSLILPLWRAAGFLTGFLPALAGKQAVFATIEAVETFVDQHYQAQIRDLSQTNHREAERAVLALFETCRLDEVDHKNDAGQRQTTPPGQILKLWTALVGTGSRAAVGMARFF